MNLSKMVILLVCILSSGITTAQKTPLATNVETPEHFMRGLLQMANTEKGFDMLDMSESVYTLDFLDAMFGKGCFTAHQNCVPSHLRWVKICGCRHFPEDVKKKKRDLLCGCPGKLEFSELSVDRANASSADVSALLNLEPHEKDKVTWRLVMTPHGWRIDDVATSDIPSLKARESR